MPGSLSQNRAIKEPGDTYKNESTYDQPHRHMSSYVFASNKDQQKEGL
jgi:hypothetical protein